MLKGSGGRIFGFGVSGFEEIRHKVLGLGSLSLGLQVPQTGNHAYSFSLMSDALGNLNMANQKQWSLPPTP